MRFIQSMKYIESITETYKDIPIHKYIFNDHIVLACPEIIQSIKFSNKNEFSKNLAVFHKQLDDLLLYKSLKNQGD